MAHPYQAKRQSKVEHSRVKELTKGYADGGAVSDTPRKGKASTNINIIIAGSGGPPAMPPAGDAGGPGPLPPPPMPPPMAPPPAGGSIPPGMLGPRSRGGRAFASGGAVSGPGWTESEKNKTKVSHDPGKNDLDDMNRKRVITYATGGKVAPATKLPGGGRGGLARLAKAHRAARGR
jgi:hypothetical protein